MEGSATAWIELHQTVWTHRKTVALAETLDLDDTYAAAHVARLWCWALDNAIVDHAAKRGLLTGMSPRAIATGAGWKGDPDALVAALFTSGYLDRKDDDVVLHDWWDYAGKYLDKREKNAARMRAARNKGDTDPTTPVDEPRATHVQDTLRARAGATVPNTTLPIDSQVVPREGDSTAPAREALPAATPVVADEPPADPVGAPPPHVPPDLRVVEDTAVEALIDGLVAGLRRAGRWPAGREPTAAFRRQERAAARELARDGWSGDDIAACTVWLTDIFDTINLRLVTGQVETWHANGRPERRGSLVPARAAPPARPAKGSIHTIMAGMSAYAARNGHGSTGQGSGANGRGDVHAGDGQSADGVATPRAGPGDGGPAVQYVPPAGRGAHG